MDLGIRHGTHCEKYANFSRPSDTNSETAVGVLLETNINTLIRQSDYNNNNYIYIYINIAVSFVNSLTFFSIIKNKNYDDLAKTLTNKYIV